jgi:hypothetical protein
MKKLFKWFDGKSDMQRFWILLTPFIVIISTFTLLYFLGLVTINLDN